MSQENLDLLGRAFEYTAKTGEIFPEVVHPDFVWDTTTFRAGIAGVTCVGVDETNRWLADWRGAFAGWSFELEDAGEQVVTVTRQHGEAKHHGPPVEMRFAQVWTFRNGLIARMDMYADRSEALDAAGLSE